MSVPAATIREAQTVMAAIAPNDRYIVVIAASLDGPVVWGEGFTTVETLARVLRGVARDTMDCCTPTVYAPTAAGELVRLTYRVETEQSKVFLTFPDGAEAYAYI